MAISKPAVTLSLRVTPEVMSELEEISEATGRTKSFLGSEAIEQYVKVQAWQVRAIKEALDEIDSGKARLIPHERVEAWLDSLGTKNELEMPK